jgi:hypothetical protein
VVGFIGFCELLFSGFAAFAPEADSLLFSGAFAPEAGSRSWAWMHADGKSNDCESSQYFFGFNIHDVKPHELQCNREGRKA